MSNIRMYHLTINLMLLVSLLALTSCITPAASAQYGHLFRADGPSYEEILDKAKAWIANMGFDTLLTASCIPAFYSEVPRFPFLQLEGHESESELHGLLKHLANRKAWHLLQIETQRDDDCIIIWVLARPNDGKILGYIEEEKVEEPKTNDFLSRKDISFQVATCDSLGRIIEQKVFPAGAPVYIQCMWNNRGINRIPLLFPDPYGDEEDFGHPPGLLVRVIPADDEVPSGHRGDYYTSYVLSSTIRVIGDTTYIDPGEGMTRLIVLNRMLRGKLSKKGIIKAGTYRVEFDLWGIKSNVLTITIE